MKTNTIKITIITVLCILFLRCNKDDDTSSPKFDRFVEFYFDKDSKDDWAVEVDASTLSPNLRFIYHKGLTYYSEQRNGFWIGNKSKRIKPSKNPHDYKTIFGVPHPSEINPLVRIAVVHKSIAHNKEQAFYFNIYKNGQLFQSNRINFNTGPNPLIDVYGENPLKKLCIRDTKNLLFY